MGYKLPTSAELEAANARLRLERFDRRVFGAVSAGDPAERTRKHELRAERKRREKFERQKEAERRTRGEQVRRDRRRRARRRRDQRENRRPDAG